ncbi:uncharacterized protein LOC128551220 [Mercenaria mercenaria]|uniref:uncharacterized protein LOC128551220 n=1 Tax=Mercenaria mercenaria TaxID=6596 RepID=UPI00234E69E7|nr:uncharacterized protein LOC128551220 [Mercenaria mercenaria]
MSEFGAFRPTNLEGQALEMNFTCLLEVCRDACAETFCGGGLSGWGRRKRNSAEGNVAHIGKDNTVTALDAEEHQLTKRQADLYDIDVGANVKIVEKYSEIHVVTEETVCMNAAILITIMIFLSAGLVGFAGSTFIFYRKWTASQSMIGKSAAGSRAENKRKDSGFPGQIENAFSRNVFNQY